MDLIRLRSEVDFSVGASAIHRLVCAFSCLLGVQPLRQRSNSIPFAVLSSHAQAATVAFGILPLPWSLSATPDGRVAQARSQPASVTVARGPLAAPAPTRSDSRTPHRLALGAVLPRTRERAPRVRRPDIASPAFRKTAGSSSRTPPEKVVQKNLATARRDPPLRDPRRAHQKAGPGGESQKMRRLPESRPISYSERPPADTAPRFRNSDPAAPSRADADQDREPLDAPVSAERVEGGVLAKPGDRRARGTIARPCRPVSAGPVN